MAAYRLDQAELVESRRMELVHQLTHVDDGVRHPRADLLAERPHLLRLDIGQRDQGIGLEGDAGQERSETVMEVAPQATSFFLASGDQLET